MKRRARERRRRPAPRPLRDGGGAAALVARLPFELSASQARALEDAVSDLDGSCPMARMLAGEVGSGKTVVALAAVQEARSRGLQCALLAPTDLLARQHFRSFRSISPEDGRAVLLTGSLPAAEAREARDGLAAGRADFVVGTHALLSEETRFHRLGLVVIDEQHRFGVDQRAALLRKAGTPHCLVLTATPIPRTLALLGFGDCDLSALDPRPGARGPVTTRVIPPDRRAAELLRIRERLAAGEQAFFVTPRIEGDEGGAEALHRELQAALAPAPVALVHGRLPAAERDARLEAFREGRTAALVATTVIEVGLDVPGATLLWIEGAERLGLATLHQLRGRIARRGQKGYCWIVEGEDAPEGSRERLRTLVDVDDGMRLAEIDLALRGPGELLGLRQSGRMGLFAGLGPNAPSKLADLVDRAAQAAELLLDAEEANACSDLAASAASPPA
jgi:ATP-dependent DNA helicase RecG